ncbi:MAG: hypothetical protein R6V05_11335 [Candidatus Brocadiia bacterium]
MAAFLAQVNPANAAAPLGPAGPEGGWQALTVAAVYVAFLLGTVLYLLWKLPRGGDQDEAG